MLSLVPCLLRLLKILYVGEELVPVESELNRVYWVQTLLDDSPARIVEPLDTVFGLVQLPVVVKALENEQHYAIPWSTKVKSTEMLLSVMGHQYLEHSFGGLI